MLRRLRGHRGARLAASCSARLAGCPRDALLAARLGHAGHFRACADDIAVACRALREIAVVSGAFGTRATGLALNARKSVVFPIGPIGQLSEGEAAAVRAWLRAHAGEFAEAAVQSSTKIMGFEIGLGAAAVAWRAALASGGLE